jgi:hypothetical protein
MVVPATSLGAACAGSSAPAGSVAEAHMRPIVCPLSLPASSAAKTLCSRSQRALCDTDACASRDEGTSAPDQGSADALDAGSKAGEHSGLRDVWGSGGPTADDVREMFSRSLPVMAISMRACFSLALVAHPRRVGWANGLLRGRARNLAGAVRFQFPPSPSLAGSRGHRSACCRPGAEDPLADAERAAPVPGAVKFGFLLLHMLR